MRWMCRTSSPSSVGNRRCLPRRRAPANRRPSSVASGGSKVFSVAMWAGPARSIAEPTARARRASAGAPRSRAARASAAASLRDAGLGRLRPAPAAVGGISGSLARVGRALPPPDRPASLVSGAAPGQPEWRGLPPVSASGLLRVLGQRDRWPRPCSPLHPSPLPVRPRRQPERRLRQPRRRVPGLREARRLAAGRRMH